MGQWWAKKRDLYSKVVFPGTHYTRELTMDWHKGGFSTKDFLDHNIDRVPVFLGGKLIFDDDPYKGNYTTIPMGLLVQFVRKDETGTVKQWFKKNHAAWKTIQKVSPSGSGRAMRGSWAESMSVLLVSIRAGPAS